MANEYPHGTVFYAANSRTYWGLVEVFERSSLQTGPGGVQQPSSREYQLVNGSGEVITLSEEALPFSLREVRDVGLELQTLEASVKESPQKQQLRELNLVTFVMAKAAIKQVA